MPDAAWNFLAVILVAILTVAGNIFIALRLRTIANSVNGVVEKLGASKKAEGKTEGIAEEVERTEAIEEARAEGLAEGTKQAEAVADATAAGQQQVKDETAPPAAQP